MRSQHLSTAALLIAFAGDSLSDVRLVGVEGALGERLINSIAPPPDCAAPLDEQQRFQLELLETMGPTLQALGYYEPQFEAALGRREDCWELDLRVDPGPPVLLRDVVVAIEPRTAAEAFQPALEAVPGPGEVLDHLRYEQLKSRITGLARSLGYLEGRFEVQRVDVFVPERVADITLRYAAGPRYAFGEVAFDATPLDPEVLESFLSFEAGSDFDSTRVVQLERDLLASEYFAVARVVPRFEQAEGGRIPIDVELTPTDPVDSSIGIGYSTNDGPRLLYRRENRLRNPRGDQYSNHLLISKVRQNARLNLRIPLGNPQREWMTWRLGLERTDIDAGVSEAMRLGLHRTHIRDLVTFTRFVDLVLERDRYFSTRASASLLVPGVAWTRAYRDDLLRTREGYRLGSTLSVGLGLDHPYLQLDFRGKWITAFDSDARWIIRGQAGVIQSDGDFADIPLSVRFFAGGDSSIRGYGFQALGARDRAGVLIGGNRLFVMSAEYEHPIRASWSVAAFADTGNAFLEGDFETATGVGIGARWFSPVGPVRLDLAWPLDGEDRSPRLHLSLGPDL